jgi:hypothetical protein
MVRIMGLGAFAGFAIATVWVPALVRPACGQSPSGPYPKFKDGVGRLPPGLTVGAPRALIPVFDTPSPERDAAPLYLDALFEFSGEMFSCFPEGPDRERRKKLAEDRWARFSEVERRWKKDPNSVSGETIDEVVAQFGEGFRKLAQAQKRDRCVFQTAVGLVTQLPHAQAARYVVFVSVCKARRELDRGDIDSAISDTETVLRLARDLLPRCDLIRHLVAGTMAEVTAKGIVVAILAAPTLRPEHCDRLLGVLRRHEDHAPASDTYATALQVEYVTTRSTTLQVVRSARARPHGSRPAAPTAKPGASSSPAASNAKSPLPSDTEAQIEAQFARTTPDGLAKQVDRVNAYFTALLALKDVPYAERLSRLPDVPRFFPADDDNASIVARLLPEVKATVAAAGRVGATLHAFECLIALRRWQITHGGAMPDDLVTAFRDVGLPAAPPDPFDGKPMRLILVEGKPVVYSVGKDGRDDGGLHDSDGDRHGGDLTFRLSSSR